MHTTHYEAHSYTDPEFPIIFHLDTIRDGRVNGSREFAAHWHEGTEVLHCINGGARVFCNESNFWMEAGDTVVVNSDALHTVGTGDNCLYHCLIAERELFNGLGFPAEGILLQEHFRDETVGRYFEAVSVEMREKKPFYKAAVRAQVIGLFVYLYRNYGREPAMAESARQNNRLNLVRTAIAYIRQNYREELTIEEICAHLGFSKYYFCHAFKELTGRTVIDYINFLRCSNARSLLATGKFNISESAEKSGFRNLSYFTRVYKRQMGELPSESGR